MRRVDKSLERAVFLVNASEGNSGLYELVWELGYYDNLSIWQKYKIAHDTVLQLVNAKECRIELFQDESLSERQGGVRAAEIPQCLNNPVNWYPTARPLPCLVITSKGRRALQTLLELNSKAARRRLIGSLKNKRRASSQKTTHQG